MTPEELLAKYQSVHPDIAALAGLSEIDWSSLHHAHGKATDFPILLSAALSQVENDREFALRLLHETIWHQGTIYQATSYTVPFIVNLIQSPDVPNQVDFAYLLASIARGKGYFDRKFYEEGEIQSWQRIMARSGKNFDEEVRHDRSWTELTHEAISNCLPVLYPYLKHPISDVRGHIGRALSYYPERAQEIIPLLEECLETEKDKYAKDDFLAGLYKLKRSLDL
jgi:hypothetical protein